MSFKFSAPFECIIPDIQGLQPIIYKLKDNMFYNFEVSSYLSLPKRIDDKSEFISMSLNWVLLLNASCQTSRASSQL